MRPVVSFWFLFICLLLQIYFSTFFDHYCQHEQFQYQSYDQCQPTVTGKSANQISDQTAASYGQCIRNLCGYMVNMVTLCTCGCQDGSI